VAGIAEVDDWLSLLRRAVRPEFAADVYRPDPNDPVLGAAPCAVAGCGLPQTCRGLCNGHDQQWRTATPRPGLQAFIQAAAPLVGHDLPKSCRVPGCLGPALRLGLCNAHWLRYRKDAGGVGVDSWAATATPDVRRQSTDECGYDRCHFPLRGKGPWCDFHARRWEKAGKPEPTEWLDSCRDYGNPVFRFTEMPEPLRTELQYILQRRRDESRSKLRPIVLHRLAAIAREHRATSLRDLPDQCVVGGVNGETRALLRWSHDRLERLRANATPDRGFDADTWNLQDLGSEPHASRSSVHVRFDGIVQPWLREAVKRCLRARVITGFAGGTVQNQARHLTAFSSWLRDDHPEVHGFSGVNRALLEAWLTAVHLDKQAGAHQRNSRIGAVRSFFEDCRRHGWTPDLPADAVLHRTDLLREPDLLPRALPEHVSAQLESEEALALVGDPTCEAIVRVLIETGLRISHILRLPIDALQRDPIGHGCLRVMDTKVRREHVLPLTDKLAAHLHSQREAVIRRWPEGRRLMLFPRPTGNPDGQRPYAYGTFRDRLDEWIIRCDVRDEHGRPLRVTAHQFRHTLGTRMINNGVPQHVVQEWLNHRSPQMTAHYARLRQETLRREWEAYRERVNIEGSVVVLDPSAPETQAEWMKHNLHTAAETLPNGFCGRPLQRECEVPNACLTCSDFLTDETFLPVHEEQRTATVAMVEAAEQRGHRRMAETNRRVLASLDNIIAGLKRLRRDESAPTDATS
jgi:integrase